MRYTLLSLCVGATWVLSAILPARQDQTTRLSPPTYREKLDGIQASMRANGATSCAGSGCHGGNPREGEGIVGKEYQAWCDSGGGNHFRAYTSLSSERSQIMAQLLDRVDNAGKDATQRADCCECHAFAVPAAQRTKRFDLADGVGCEACHGPSEKWLSAHLHDDWRQKLNAEDRAQLGFYDMRDLGNRAEKCLECHLGTATKKVTHTMLAAGHPALTFELTGDLWDVPRHWKDRQSLNPGEDAAGFHARTWAVGQAVALRESMLRLIRELVAGGPPDFALLECYACHHDLDSQPPNWRQRVRLEPPSRATSSALGEPGWNASSWAACRHLVFLLRKEDLPRFEDDVNSITRGLALTRTDHRAVADAASDLARRANSLATTASTHRFTQQEILELMHRIASDALPGADYRAAEQVYRALYALYVMPRWPEDQPHSSRAASQPAWPTTDDPVIAAMIALQGTIGDQDENPAPQRFDPAKFATALKNVAKALDGVTASPAQRSPDRPAEGKGAPR